MALNATSSTAQNTFNQIQNTSKGIAVSIEQTFAMYHAGKLTYERIYNDFIPKIKTAINALPPSENFPVGLEASIDAYAAIASGSSTYSADYKQLEIYMDELLVLTEAAIPVDAQGYALVVKGAGVSELIPEMMDISNKLDQIVAIIG